MLKTCFDTLRLKAPLIHNITNYVTTNDVANMLLACGASPIMAEDPDDVAEIVALSQGLNINLGNFTLLPVMEVAGKASANLGHTTLLDPVGCGASKKRTTGAKALIKAIPFTAIRGNASEIKTLFYGDGHTQGVDAHQKDAVSQDNLAENITLVKILAAQTGAIIAMTGVLDLVADSHRCYVIANGRPEMSRITGTGCQLSGMMTAFLAANPNHPLDAAAAAVATMGLAGEIAYNHLAPYEGNATYRNRIIDAVYHMTGSTLAKGADYDIY